MEITDIKIRRIITEGRLRAVVSITLDNMLAVHDIKIVQGDERLFVAMPSRKDENGVFRDIVHPISAAARKKLEAEIHGNLPTAPGTDGSGNRGCTTCTACLMGNHIFILFPDF